MEKTIDTTVAIVNFIVAILVVKDMYSKLWHAFWFSLSVWAETRCPKSRTPGKNTCIDEKRVANQDQRMDCDDEGAITLREVEVVMRKLGTFYDPNCDKLAEKLSAVDIAVSFEEQEPGDEELREAFSMFDENNDGFIDANELREVLRKLCLAKVSDSDCSTMIRACDRNGDGLIEFDEFVRLVANSFT